MAQVQPIEIREYVDLLGRAHFLSWRKSLDYPTRARVLAAISKLASGNTTAIKGLGDGLQELRLDFGPGYRLYLTRQRDTLIILFAGGSKRTQAKDIDAARQLLMEYKQRRKVKK